MVSVQARLMRPFIRLTLKRKKLDTIEKIRDMVAGLEGKAHRQVSVEKTTVNGVAAEWLRPIEKALPKTAFLYLHGGGYVSGSPDTHRGSVSQIVHASKIPALLLDYRLAPEHPFPAALEDAINAYHWLLDNGYKAENIIIAGDSAGGGLTLATLLKLRDEGMQLPAAAVAISPFTDLLGTGESVQTHQKRDPWLKPMDLEIVVDNYVGDYPKDHPYVSPVYGDLSNLPPLFIQVGDREILLSDALRAAEAAKAAGTPVELHVWEGMWHVWHAFYAIVPESRRAIQDIAVFARSHVAQQAQTAPHSVKLQYHLA